MPISKARVALLALSMAGFVILQQPAQAQALTRDGFAFPDDSKHRIVVFRPDVHVGSLGTGGLDQPNAEWTEDARNFIQAALIGTPELKGANIRFLDELAGSQAEILTQYRGLFEIIGSTMLAHATKSGEILPTKLIEKQVGEDKYTMRIERYSRLDWELGPGASQLSDITGADYAMLIYTYDSYGDSGRKAAQALGAVGCLIGVCVLVPAGIHVGFAGLVELRTGHIVWFNTDLAMGGDVRDGEGAVKRVGQLLAGFPSLPALSSTAENNWSVEQYLANAESGRNLKSQGDAEADPNAGEPDSVNSPDEVPLSETIEPSDEGVGEEADPTSSAPADDGLVLGAAN